jgi:CRISPR-associated protein Cas2
MWLRIIEYVSDGRALMVHSTKGEQRLAFKVHGHDWTPVDFDGITLMRRRSAPDYIPSAHAPLTKPGNNTNSPSGKTPAAPSEDVVWRRRSARRKFKRKPDQPPEENG